MISISYILYYSRSFRGVNIIKLKRDDYLDYYLFNLEELPRRESIRY